MFWGFLLLFCVCGFVFVFVFVGVFFVVFLGGSNGVFNVGQTFYNAVLPKLVWVKNSFITLMFWQVSRHGNTLLWLYISLWKGRDFRCETSIIRYFSFQPVFHNWCNKGRGICYPVCGMVHIKEPLLLIDKSSLCGDSGFPFSLSEWSLTICLTPYNRI